MSLLFRNSTASAVAFALLAAATLAISPADAQQRRRGDGAGVAAGVLGGLAAGALVGGVLAGPGYADPGYADPGYGPEDIEGAGGCPLVRQPVYDGAGRFAGYRAVPSC